MTDQQLTNEPVTDLTSGYDIILDVINNNSNFFLLEEGDNEKIYIDASSLEDEYQIGNQKQLSDRFLHFYAHIYLHFLFPLFIIIILFSLS